MTPTTHPTPQASTPPTTTDITDLADALTGLHPDLDTAIAALTRLAHTPLNPDDLAAVVCGLAGSGPSLIDLIAAVIHRTTHPTTNPHLATLPTGQQTQAAQTAAEAAAYLTELAPTELIDEIPAALFAT